MFLPRRIIVDNGWMTRNVESLIETYVLITFCIAPAEGRSGAISSVEDASAITEEGIL
jgi:hypothetical protein